MKTDSTPAAPTTPSGPRWITGCTFAAIAVVALLAYGAMALDNLQKGMDGYGQMEQDGPSGNEFEPLGPGETARYEDGLDVTVSTPHPEAGGVYTFSVTYENGTDDELLPGGDSAEDSVLEYGPAPLVVRPGKPRDDYVSDYDLTVLDREKTASLLLPPLAEGEKRTVPVRIKPTRAGIPVTVEVAVPDAGYRETAYFQLTAS
ncbi:hypothetical protein [Streptomyces cyanogenus]|uniref:Uncharacterized protein n=1 Tax=Streptomyces cyanogenus TaxID=80860 RepID=A0ABX7U4E1_STRCY|nr:hypothetical protein [Streptomyces cyanogenus]QTE02944.1 hypothetical protein S1361_36760 [Streptomyces cyanogenus]